MKMKNLTIFKNRIIPAEVVYALTFAIMTVFSRHTIYSDGATSTVLTVKITPFVLSDALVIFITMPAVYVILQLLKLLFGILSERIFEKPETESLKSSKRIVNWIMSFAFIMLCYVPYLMSYWPGGIYNDTSYTLDIVHGSSPWSDQNTVLYALFWKAVISVGSIFGQGDYGGLKLMTVLQCTAIASVAASFVTWLRSRGVRRWVTILMTLTVALMPVFPFYGISLWKETWFGLVFFLYTWMWYAISTEIGTKENYPYETSEDLTAKGKLKRQTLFDIKIIVVYIIVTLMMIFGRNNGMYVVLCTMAVSLAVLFKRVPVSEWKKAVIANITIIMLALIIRGPVYGAAGIQKTSVSESLGIPLQQTAYMISNAAVSDTVIDDVNYDVADNVRNSLGMSDAEYETIVHIMPMEAWINLYNPVVVDSIKFAELFNREYFETHAPEFMKSFTGIVCKNPMLAIKGYLLSTIGFWDAYKASSSAYVCTQHTVQSEYFMSDYFTQKTGLTLSDIVGPRWYISAGALVWIMLALFVLAPKKKRVSVLTYLPGIALWLTYMLATPLSFSFRYLFGLLLCIPLYLCPIFGFGSAND